MGGSSRVARLAFMWGLIACGAGAQTASAQQEAKSVQKPAAVVPWARVKEQPSSSEVRPGPFMPDRFRDARVKTYHGNAVADLNDQHTIVVSTLVLVLAGVIVLLLVL